MKRIVVENMNKIEANNLACVRGGLNLFSGLNFCIEAGQALRIVGKNGCGKSSLLRIIAGLLEPSKGQLTKIKSASLLFLDHKLLMKTELSVIENLEFWFDIFNSKQQQNLTALKSLNLSPLLTMPFKYLSSGQKKRVQLALLFLKPAPIWVLDEPLLSLDNEHINVLKNIVNQHLLNGGLLIYASHDAIPDITEQTLNLEEFRLEYDSSQAA